jgi:uncharacterized protein YbaP (TraB family)
MKTLRTTDLLGALGMFGALALCAPFVGAQDAKQPGTETLEEVKVSDEPGPLMWRVSKDDHVVWIIGTMSPIPTGLTWNDRQVRAVLAESDEVLGQIFYNAKVDGGAFAVIRSIPAMLKARKNPDGATLVDLLPPDQYARWRRLIEGAIGKPPDEDMEVWRPMLLADMLYYETLKSRKLKEGDVVTPRLHKLAREAKVPVRRREVDVAIDKPRKLIAEFRELPRAREIECLIATMDFIDQEMPKAEARARAWAIGEPALLAEDLAALNREPCTLTSVRESSLKDRLIEMEQQSRQDFLDMVGYALLGRGTTVTTLPIQFLTGPKSLLNTLRASGYAVESPRR